MGGYLWFFFFIWILIALVLVRREQKNSTSKLVLSAGKFILTLPERQAGAYLHGTAWTAPGPNTKAQDLSLGKVRGR